MPSLPEHAITTTFDLSLFGGFARGFGELFSDIPNLIILLFTLVFISFFDATGTLISLSRQCGSVNEEGEIKGIGKALLSTALGGIIGSIFCTSTITAYIESATGIGWIKNRSNGHCNRHTIYFINFHFTVNPVLIYNICYNCGFNNCRHPHYWTIKRY